MATKLLKYVPSGDSAGIVEWWKIADPGEGKDDLIEPTKAVKGDEERTAAA